MPDGVIYDLQPGPQQMAAESEADIIFFGGSKGCGKSVWLYHDSAKWYDLPGHSSLLFRRTYPELTGDGSLWQESYGLYQALGGTAVESRLEWRFPAGSHIRLRHMQHPKDALAYNGKNLGDVGLDELTFFTEDMIWILISCQRSGVGGYAARPRLRATMNPDPDSWVYSWVEWYLDEAGFPDPAKRGVIRWFGRVDGKLRWYNSKADAIRAGVETPKSFTFIGALIWDNPALLKLRPEYLANLRALPPVEQARYLGGNWKVRAQAGDYFRQEWFPIRGPGALSWRLRGHPTDDDIVAQFRMWDLAGTPWLGCTVNPQTPARGPGQGEQEPAWTRGGLFGLTRHNDLILLDMVGWRDSPGEIENAIIATARADGRRTAVCLPHDPGQAGVYQVEQLEKRVRRDAGVSRVHAVRATKGKEEYAAVASRWAHRGRILVQQGPWNAPFFREIEAFPANKTKSGEPVHKDQVDVVSQAVEWALEHPHNSLPPVSLDTSRAEWMRDLDPNRFNVF